MKLFIVDDDLDFAESLSVLLGIDGHRVCKADNGDEAVERAVRENFDLILMDMRLPGLDGVECFKRIRAQKPHAQVAMMTAYSVEGKLEQAREEGALAVLQKPLDRQQLDGVLRAARDRLER